MARGELLEKLEKLMADVNKTLDKLDPKSLLDVHTVQGEKETGLAILVHVVEHFSYHTGQIGYIVKSTKDVDLGYFADQDLSQLNP